MRIAASLSLCLLACASGPVPCASATSCPTGRECQAARCVPEGGVSVAANTHRLLLRPAAVAVASSERGADGLPGSVTLGRSGSPANALYVRFDPSFRERGKLAAAFLLLDPREGAPSGRDVALEVWRAKGSVRGETVTWSQQPGFAPPFARGIGRATRAAPVRIDVSELVRFVSAHPAQDHGFVVRATSEDELGFSVATGTDGGLPPRLDVYLE